MDKLIKVIFNERYQFIAMHNLGDTYDSSCGSYLASALIQTDLRGVNPNYKVTGIDSENATLDYLDLLDTLDRDSQIEVLAAYRVDIGTRHNIVFYAALLGE